VSSSGGSKGSLTTALLRTNSRSSRIRTGVGERGESGRELREPQVKRAQGSSHHRQWLATFEILVINPHDPVALKLIHVAQHGGQWYICSSKTYKFHTHLKVNHCHFPKWGNMFQANETVGAKALRQECAWCDWRSVWRPVWLKWARGLGVGGMCGPLWGLWFWFWMSQSHWKCLSKTAGSPKCDWCVVNQSC
jgi:hypothetical protein